MKIIFNDLSEPIKEKLTNALLVYSTVESKDKIDDFLDQTCIVIDDCNKAYIVIDDSWFSDKTWKDRFKIRIKNILNVTIEDYKEVLEYAKELDIGKRLSDLDLFIKSLEEQIEKYKEAKKELEEIFNLYLNSKQ